MMLNLDKDEKSDRSKRALVISITCPTAKTADRRPVDPSPVSTLIY